MEDKVVVNHNLKGYSWFMVIVYFAFAAVMIVIGGIDKLQTTNGYLVGGMLLIPVIFALAVTFSERIRNNIVKNKSKMYSYRITPVLYFLSFVMVLGDYGKPYNNHSVEALILAVVIILGLYIWDIIRMRKSK